MKIILQMRFFKKPALIMFILCLSGLAHAQKVITVTNALSVKYFGKNVYWYQDQTNQLSFEQIRQQGGLFKASNLEVPNLGISPNNNWLKFTLVNNSGSGKFILELPNPIIDEADLYIVKGKQVDSIKYANYQPLSKRQYKHQFYLFDIAVDKGASVDCYLRLKSNQQILAPLSLKTDRTILTDLSNSDTRSGIYLGIMAVMLLYNLFIYFITKDTDYLAYCHYIFWVALTQATLLGYSHRYLWADNKWLSKNMVILCGAMSGIATIIFSKAFLNTRRLIPRLNMALNITIGFYLLSLLVLLSGKAVIAFQIVNLTAAIVSVLIMYVAWAVYRKKYAFAKYFLISWSIFFASILIFVFKDYNLVPYNLFTVHSVEIGSALEAIFLSFALAARINLLKKEKEASQAETLRSLRENERIVTEQNIMLEKKVKERTYELDESNQGLNQTLEELKQAQSQLVESEKMASLGQLTAGLAHEINNPINFVTSNINPLKRDVEMLLDALAKVEEVGSSDHPPAEKQRLIEEYKEELDFDYLVVEIRHLIKGIKEGASRTAEIVKGLRIFSRLDEDDLKRADINEGIESTLIIANNLLNNRIKVIKEFGTLPLVECYAGKLNQVFLNMISNAIYAVDKQFGEKEGGTIRISTHAEGGNIIIKFIDNGIGMNGQTIKKVFEPFFTTKEVGEGTGLGMSIAYNTIKKHHGRMSINSEPGKGTEFVILIPIIFDTKDG